MGNFEKVKPLIEKAFRKVEKKFQKCKGLILTESDLKCQIYLELLKIPELSSIQETEEKGIFSIPLHTELSWFDEHKKLAMLPDITIFEPKNLNILKLKEENKISVLPSKDCVVYYGHTILIELKFIRKRKGIEIFDMQNEILEDFNKMKKLQNIYEGKNLDVNKMFCYIVVFNKTNKICQEFSEFVESEKYNNWCKIIYGTGGVNYEDGK